PLLAMRKHCLRAVDAVHLEAGFEQRHEQPSRARHGFEHRTRLARKARCVPRDLGLARAWLVVVVEQRAESAVGRHGSALGSLVQTRRDTTSSSRAAAAIASIQTSAAATSPVHRRKPWIMPAQSTTRVGTAAASRRRAY